MYEDYINLTPNELHQRLLKRKLHPVAITQIKAEVAHMKESRRINRITRTHRKAEWANVLDPLRYELNSAKVGRKYDLTDAIRLDAFDAYIAVMEKVLAKLLHPSRLLEQTPMQIAKEHNATGKGSPISNDGEHWVDWIPPKIKERIGQAFMELPHRPKAKRKVPFQRVMLPDQHEEARKRLLKATHKEIATLERRQMVAPTDERKEKIERMHKAIKIIEAMTDNEAVPATWNTLNGIEIDSQ
tara:strand:+ start:371 stop:1099 length:729 start_codon:yes stop_codon:yes gene_type:complete